MTVALPPTLTILQVAEYRRTLLAALEGGAELEVDAGALTEIDVAGLQLLEAAHQSALHRGVALRFPGGRRDVIERCAALVGLRLAADSTRWREVDHA
jgi:anti-anti-sigma regulatory factor